MWHRRLPPGRGGLGPGARFGGLVSAAVVCFLLLPPRASGHTPESVIELSRRIARSPEDPALRLERAERLHAIGRLEEALEDVERAGRLSPRDPRVALHRGLLLFDLGRHQGALVALNDHIERTGGNARSLATRGRILEERGDLEGAARSYAAALRENPSVTLFLAHGRALRALDRGAEALSVYRDGIATTGGAAILRRALIELALDVGAPGLALPEANALVAQARVRARWLLLRARVFDALGEEDAARSDRRAALDEASALHRRRPVPGVATLRAEALMALGREREAEALLVEAVRRAPELRRARVLLRRARARREAR